MTRWWLVRSTLAGLVLTAGPVWAQAVNSPQGWPGTEPAPASRPAAPAAERPAEQPPKNAPKPRRVRPTTRIADVVAATAVAPPAPAIEAPPAVVAAPVAVPAPVAASPEPPSPAPATSGTAEVPAAPAVVTGFDLVAALQQQSQMLARLAAELEAERAVVAQQGRLIEALEKKAAAAAPAVPPPPPPPPPAITVDTGGAKLRLAGLVQGWFIASDAGVADTFRLRRSEIKVSGDVNAKLKWQLVIDAAKALSVSNTYVNVSGQRVVSDTGIGQSSRVMQDAYTTIRPSGNFSVDIGQQKLPLSMEGVQSSSRLDTVERALSMSDKARGGTYGDVRDIGVAARGRVAAGQVEYAAGVFNGLGESQNDVDRDGQKPLAGRVVFRPRAVKGLQFGASAARGMAASSTPARRERRGVEALYSLGRFSTSAELMTGRDGALQRRGFYAQGLVRATRTLDAVVRADVWDPDTATDATAAAVRERDWLGGVSWRIAGPSAVLQVNYVRKTFLDVQPSRHVLAANIQTVF